MSNVSELTPTGQRNREREDAEDAYYALQDENQLLLREVEELQIRMEEIQQEKEQQQQQQQHKEQQSHKQWIAENLEEAQQLIDNIVGIKGITEDPLGAAIKMGISHQHEYYCQTQQQLPRVSISSSIVPSNEELYGY
jgi:molecular chaperone GrpE (heat shock protein)